MTLSIVGSSAWVSSTSAVTPTNPTGLAVGDLVVLTLVSKYDTAVLASDPAGWDTPGTPAVNSGRPTGVDNGNTRMRVFYKVWQSGDTMPSLSPASNNVSTVHATAYRSTSGAYDVVAMPLADDSTGSPLAVTSAAVALAVGDMVLVDQVLNGDAPTWGTTTVTASGITFGSVTTPTADANTTSGTDLRMRCTNRAVSAGSGTVAITASTTLAGTTTNAVGTVNITRIREAVAPLTASPADPVGVSDARALAVTKALADSVGVTDSFGSAAPPGGPSSYTPSAFNSAGTFGTYVSYKEITVSVESGDLLVAFGVCENTYGNGTADIATTAGSTATTDTWVIDRSNNANDSPGFVMGHTTATSTGYVQARITVPASSSGTYVGVGIWVIPAAEWTGTPSVTSFGVDDADGQVDVTLANTSTVFYAGADWAAADPGATLTPSGGAEDSVYFDSIHYAVVTGHWVSRPAGTMAYGPAAAAGAAWTGAVLAVQEASSGGSAVVLEVGKGLSEAVGVVDSVDVVLDSPGLTASPADPVGVTDTAARALDAVRTQGDAVGVTDARTLAVTKGLADPVGATDATALGQTRSPADAVGIGDTTVLERSTTVPDAAGATDALALEVARPLTEAVGAIDAMTALLSKELAPADPVGVSDAVALEAARPLTDAVPASDAAATVVDASRTVPDAVGATDALAVEQFRALADVVVGTDQASSELSSARAADDPVELSDLASPVLAAARSQDDPVAVTDALTVVQDTAVALADDAPAADALDVVQDLVVTVVDPAPVADAADVSGAGAVTLSDAVGVTDAVQADLVDTTVHVDHDDPVGASDALAVGRELVLEDLTGVSDASSLQVEAQRFTADTVGVTDAAATERSYARTADDTVEITDVLAAGQDQHIVLADGAGVSDSLSVDTGASAVIADQIGVTDATAVIQITAVTRSDAVGASDTLSRVLDVARGPADVVGVSDALVVATGGASAIDDAVEASDTVTVVLTRRTTVADAVGVSDTVEIVLAREVALDDAVGLTDATERAVLLEVLLTEDVGLVDTLVGVGRPFIDYEHTTVTVLDAPPRHIVDLPADPTHLVVLVEERHIVFLDEPPRHIEDLPEPPTHIVLL